MSGVLPVVSRSAPAALLRSRPGALGAAARGRPRAPAERSPAALPGACAGGRGASRAALERPRRRHWYDARLGDRERYPLATIWDIVPLFESLDAIAIAQPTPANRRAVARFAAGAERYLNRGLRPLPGYSPYPGDRAANTETWFDDNGWWGLAFVNAYRATGTRRYLSDAERAPALHRGRRLGPRRGGIWWNTDPPLQGRRGAGLGHAAGHAALRADQLGL